MKHIKTEEVSVVYFNNETELFLAKDDSPFLYPEKGDTVKFEVGGPLYVVTSKLFDFATMQVMVFLDVQKPSFVLED